MKKGLTEFYVYNAMIDFLYGYEKRRYGYGTLQEILQELSPLPEGGTINPAIWTEWKSCVNKSLKDSIKEEPSGEAALRVYTNLQAFDVMVDFLVHYYKRTLFGGLRTVMEVILALSEDSTDQAAWTDWNNAAKKALQKQTIERPLDETIERRLTKLQAFNVMMKFLDGYYEETSADLGGLVSSLYFTIDGGTADPAFWEDWGTAIKKVLHEQNSEKHVDEILGISVTESQAFEAMVQLFRNYFEPNPDDPDAVIFFEYLHLLPDGNGSDSPTIREQWKRCVDSALKEKPGIRKYLILCRG